MLDPGDDPKNNLQFQLVLACILKAVDTHADLLRQSASKALVKQYMTEHQRIVFNGDDLLGTFLWLVIFTDLGLAIYFIIDNSILIKPEKLMPKRLMDGVRMLNRQSRNKCFLMSDTGYKMATPSSTTGLCRNIRA